MLLQLFYTNIQNYMQLHINICLILILYLSAYNKTFNIILIKELKENRKGYVFFWFLLVNSTSLSDTGNV